MDTTAFSCMMKPFQLHCMIRNCLNLTLLLKDTIAIVEAKESESKMEEKHTVLYSGSMVSLVALIILFKEEDSQAITEEENNFKIWCLPSRMWKLEGLGKWVNMLVDTFSYENDIVGISLDCHKGVAHSCTGVAPASLSKVLSTLFWPIYIFYVLAKQPSEQVKWAASLNLHRGCGKKSIPLQLMGKKHSP